MPLPLPTSLVREERLEHALQHLGRDAGAVSLTASSTNSPATRFRQLAQARRRVHAPRGDA